EEGADEALGFPVCLGAVGPRAQVTDAESAAGDGVEGRAVAGAVVAEQPLDLDAMAVVEGDSAAQEADDRDCFLVVEHLSVGEPAVTSPARVDSAISGVSAISAAVKRNLRSLTIDSTRLAGVRFVTRRGAEERSKSPWSPSSR